MFFALMTLRAYTKEEALMARTPAIRLIQTEIATLGWRYYIFLTITALCGVISLMPPKLSVYLTEGLGTINTISQASAEDFLSYFVIFSIVVAASVFVSDFIQAICQEWICLRTEGSLRLKALKAIQNTPLEEIDGAQRGEWMTRVSSDLKQAESFITETIPEHLINFVVLLGVSVLFGIEKPEVAVVVLVSALILGFFNLLIQTKMEPRLSKLRDMHGSVYHSLLESIESNKLLRSAGKQGFMVGRFQNRINSITRSSLRVAKVMGLLRGSTGIFTQALTTGFLIVAAWSVHKGTLTLADALMYPFYIGMLYSHALGLISGIFDWKLFKVEGGRLADILDVPALPDDLSHSDIPVQDIKAIHYDNLTAGYEEAPLLDKLSLSLEKGKTTVIVGPSGIGKSTLVETLAGLRAPLKGCCCLEGPKGKGTSRPAIPTNVTAITEQIPYLFEMSLAENIALAEPSPEIFPKVNECLEQVGLLDFVNQQGGPDFAIRERGLNISQGQAWRVGLARALYLDKPFLMVDEPFAALDESSIHKVTETLNNLRHDRGVVIVTHYVPDQLMVDQVIDLTPFSIGYFEDTNHQDYGGYDDSDPRMEPSTPYSDQSRMSRF